METVSEVDISYSKEELPPAIEAVLRKIDSAQLARAKQEIADQLQVIQSRVNRILAFQDETYPAEEKYDKEETMKRLQMFYDFFQSSLERKNNLIEVLQWLRDTTEDLQDIEHDEDFKFTRSIKTEWVEEMDVKIQTFISDVMACILQVQKLCGLLFDIDTKKVKKKKGICKEVVWRWWREQKVDAQTVLKIQQHQPPSTDHLVSEITLGTKTAAELSFMLKDMANYMSCKKAMSIAFKFAQTGLHNLNKAFQAQSRQIEQLHTAQEQKDKHLQAALAYTKEELAFHKMLVSELERKNSKLKENNEACLLKINQLEEASKQQPVITAPSDKEYFQFLLSTAPQHSSQRPHKIIQAPQIMEKEVIQEFQPEPLESKVDDFEDPDYFEVTEKKTSNLLDDFQSVVEKIVKTSLLKRPGVEKQLEGMSFNVDNTRDNVKLYTVLVNVIHESFKQLDIKLPYQVHETILQRPSADSKPDQDKFSDDTSKTPVGMLKEVSETFPKHLKDHEVPSHIGDKQERMKVTNKKDESRQAPSSAVIDQFSNMTNICKEQTSELPLDRNGLSEMSDQLQTEQMVQITDRDTLIPSSDCTPEKKEVSEVPKSYKTSTEGLIFKRKVSRCIRLDTSPQKPEKPLPSETLLSDSEEHSKKDMKTEEENMARTLLKGVRYQMNKETQRTNLLLLQNALRKGRISPQLHKQATEHLENHHSTKLKCLSVLLRKYIAFRALQQVRRQLDIKIRFAQKHNDGQAPKECYIILTKLERYEKQVLGRWRSRQEAHEQEHNVNLTRIICLFKQLRKDYSLNLLNPSPCQSYSLGKHFLAFKPQGTQLPVISRQQYPFPSKKIQNYLLRSNTPQTGASPPDRESVKQEVPKMWKCSLPLSDVQLTSKPVPIIPRLLEMNLNYNNQRTKKRTGQDWWSPCSTKKKTTLGSCPKI